MAYLRLMNLVYYNMEFPGRGKIFGYLPVLFGREPNNVHLKKGGAE
jgi:hypothetical protein